MLFQKVYHYLSLPFIKSKNEIDALNGLRAYSIIAVIILHLWGLYRSLGALSEVNHFLDLFLSQYQSVMDLFFMLSGFLISGWFFDNQHLLYNANQTQSGIIRSRNSLSPVIKKNTAYLHYLLKRFFRIVPVYYLAILIYALFSYHQIQNLSSIPPTEEVARALETYQILLSSSWNDALFVSNYTKTRLMSHGWSLSAEVQFYILIPFYLYFYFKFAPRHRIILLVVSMLPAFILRILLMETLSADTDSYNREVYYPFHTRYDSFLAGILLMEIYYSFLKREPSLIEDRQEPYVHNFEIKILSYIQHPHSAKQKITELILLGVSFTIMLLSQGVLSNKHHPALYASRFTFFQISFGIIFLLALIDGSMTSRLLSGTILRSISRISYGMYLSHILVLPWITGRVFGAHSVSIANSSYGIIAIILVCILATYITGLLSYYFIEQPFMMLRKFLHDRLA